MIYAYELLKKGGAWLGGLRTHIQNEFCGGNGDTIIWGSAQELLPHPTMTQIEKIGAAAVAAERNRIIKLIEDRKGFIDQHCKDMLDKFIITENLDRCIEFVKDDIKTRIKIEEH